MQQKPFCHEPEVVLSMKLAKNWCESIDKRILLRMTARWP